MAEQLARCASALPAGAEPRGRGARAIASPQRVFPMSGLCEPEEDWAQPTSGGLCLDSLPLHMPSHGAHGGATGGAYGIHGRRPAIATTPWTANPATLGTGWWEEARAAVAAEEGTGGDGADEGSTAPPSPIASSVEAHAATGVVTPTRAVAAELEGGVATEQSPHAQQHPPRGGLPPARRASRPASHRTVRSGPSDARLARSAASTCLRCRGTRLRTSCATAATTLAGWEAGGPIAAAEEIGGAERRLAAGGGGRRLCSEHEPPPPPPRRGRSAHAALTPRSSDGRRPQVARLSVAGQQALTGALQVAIARHPILATISTELRKEMAAACMRELKVPAGTVVAAQGADCDAFAVVGSGVFDGYIAESGPMPVRKYVRGDALATSASFATAST